MSATLAELIEEADRLLEPGSFEDYALNGLQVPGPDEVQTIATGVSANAELFELAAAEHAQLLIVHHGLFWGSGVRALDAVMKRRLKIIFDADIALAAYHLPLDAHPDLGNNAQLADLLGAEARSPFGMLGGRPIGCLATLPGIGLGMGELAGLLERAGSREPLMFETGPSTVQRIAIVSGAGADHIQEAADAGAQALLTGEPEERTLALARELAINFIAAGHHATETLGVQRLGAHLADRFGLRHVFLDTPNPV